MGAYPKLNWKAGSTGCLILIIGLLGGCKKKEAESGGAYPRLRQTGTDIVARVGEREITGLELARLSHAYSQNLIRRGQKPPPDLEGFLLERMIESELLYQSARKIDLPDLEERVEEKYRAEAERYERLRQEDQLPPHRARLSFEEALFQGGQSGESYRESLRRQVLVEAFLEERVHRQISVSEDEVVEFYEKNREELAQPERIRARQIFLPVGEDATAAGKAAVREKALDLKKRIEGGEDFEALALRYSACPSKSRGGDLGFLSPGRLEPELEEAAWGLETGKVSPPVQTRYGYHLIQVGKRIPPGIPSQDDAREMVVAIIKARRAAEKLKELMEELRGEIKVEKLPGSEKRQESAAISAPARAGIYFGDGVGVRDDNS